MNKFTKLLVLVLTLALSVSILVACSAGNKGSGAVDVQQAKSNLESNGYLVSVDEGEDDVEYVLQAMSADGKNMIIVTYFSNANAAQKQWNESKDDIAEMKSMLQDLCGVSASDIVAKCSGKTICVGTKAAYDAMNKAAGGSNNGNGGSGGGNGGNQGGGATKHVCQHACVTCGKCTDDSCENVVCSNKCLGHGSITPTHVCGHVCSTCGLCTDDSCENVVCSNKCLGHDVTYAILTMDNTNKCSTEMGWYLPYNKTEEEEGIVKKTWTENGITVVNNIGTSTSETLVYANPDRFYKNTTLTISYTTEMKAIRLKVDEGSSYVRGWDNMEVAGATIRREGDIVLITLETPATSFETGALKGKVRIYSVEVFTQNVPVLDSAPTPEDAQEITVARALEIGATLADGDRTREYYKITGVYTRDAADATDYGKGYLAADGSSIYIYGMISEDGETKFANFPVKPQTGDVITVVAQLKNYQGTIELMDVRAQGYGVSSSYTLTVWCAEEDREMTLNMLDEYKSLNPQNTYTFIVANIGENSVSSAVALDIDSAGDVFSFYNSQLGILLNENVLYKIPNAYNSQIESQIDAAVSACSNNGNYYAVPYAYENSVLYYNKAFVSEQDVKSIETLLSKAISGVDANLAMDMSDSRYTTMFLYAAGMEIFGPAGTDPNSINLANANTTKGCKYIQWLGMQSKFKSILPADQTVAFKNGKVAAIISSPAMANQFRESLGSYFGVTMLPTVKFAGESTATQLVSFSNIKMYGISNKSTTVRDAKTTAEACKLAAFLANASNQEKRVAQQEKCPTDYELFMLAENCGISTVEAVIKQSNYSKLTPGLPQMSAYWTPMANFLYGVYTMNHAESVWMSNLQAIERKLKEA